MAVIANCLFRIMPGDGADRLVGRSAFKQLGDRLMSERPGSKPTQSTSLGDGAEGGTNEAGACRTARIVDTLFHAEWNEVVLRFDRAALPCLGDEAAGCPQSYFIERHATNAVAILDRFRNADDWRIKVEAYMLQAQRPQLAAENCTVARDERRTEGRFPFRFT